MPLRHGQLKGPLNPGLPSLFTLKRDKSRAPRCRGLEPADIINAAIPPVVKINSIAAHSRLDLQAPGFLDCDINP
jgi:hypothetical protein